MRKMRGRKVGQVDEKKYITLARRQKSLIYDLALAVLARRFESAINRIKKRQTQKCLTFFGAAGRTRTDTVSLPQDFEFFRLFYR